MRGDLREAAAAVLAALEGSWAFAVLQAGSGRVVVAAFGSPMCSFSTPGNRRFRVQRRVHQSPSLEWVDEFYALRTATS